MPQRRNRSVPVVVLLAALGAVGCAEDEPAPVDYPDDAVHLRQNQPTVHEEYELVAANLTEESGIVVVTPPGGTATNVQVSEGETVTEGELSFEVLDIVPPDEDDEPLNPTGRIVILPAE